MSEIKETVLKFVLKSSGNPMDTLSRFHPSGKTVLNRTTWMGKEPRSCGVTSVKGRPYSADTKDPLVWDIEVSYRPKGCITYVGDTKYDGWTAMVLDRKKDGTLLDGQGKPLAEGQSPVYLPYELYEDMEFNDIDFGEFVGESVLESIKHLTFDDVMRQAENAKRFSTSMMSSFVAPRKQRPFVKIILSSAPSGIGADGFGTRIININNQTPQLQQVLVDQFNELVSGFMEGRYSLKSFSTDDFVFVELDDVLVDCTPNEQGKESRFHVLGEYLSKNFLEDLALRLMANYEVEASVVDGKNAGLLLKPARKPKN